eukprot:Seg16436.1 transcript_id=Seg16436.1/GoldUCD/mRNA.D3Y31 product="putative plasmid-partitioning protein ParB" protein_id=Seg16436.1/GoldUCD/D3Y31
MKNETEEEIMWVNACDIQVINPRRRDKIKFAALTASIEKIGLKKPITISKTQRKKKPFNLVCGQGRLEASIALGYRQIPARVLDISQKETLVRSLIENIARRTPNIDEELGNIVELKEKGYSIQSIAKKIGLSYSRTQRYLSLYSNGETRLLKAVLNNKISISTAAIIAESGDEVVQNALLTAFKNKHLKCSDLKYAKKLVDQRKLHGKNLKSRRRKIDATALVAIYKKDAEKKEDFIRKSNTYDSQVTFISISLKKLLEEQEFMSLLVDEDLNELPASLSDKITKS